MNLANGIRLDGRYYTREEILHGAIDHLLKEQWSSYVHHFIHEWMADTSSVWVRTSGSTGMPKSIELPKKLMIESAKNTCSFLNVSSSDQALLALPASFIGGKMMITRAFVCGFNLLTVKPSSNPFKGLQKDIDFAALTPYQCAESLNDHTFKSVKKIIIGGASIPQHLENRLKDLPARIFATYGMTETASHIAMRSISTNDNKAIFRVVGDYSIGTDSRNCLVIRHELLPEGQVVTNDVVELADEKSFYWLGRWDNVINSGGVKIVVEQLENEIAQLIHVNFVVMGKNHPQLGEVPVLIIESDEKQTPKQTIEDKLTHLKNPFSKPKQIFYCSHFPETSGGKIDRIKLKNRVGLK